MILVLLALCTAWDLAMPAPNVNLPKIGVTK